MATVHSKNGNSVNVSEGDIQFYKAVKQIIDSGSKSVEVQDDAFTGVSDFIERHGERMESQLLSKLSKSKLEGGDFETRGLWRFAHTPYLTADGNGNTSGYMATQGYSDAKFLGKTTSSSQNVAGPVNFNNSSIASTFAMPPALTVADSNDNIPTGKFVTKGYVDTETLSKISTTSQSMAGPVAFDNDTAATNFAIPPVLTVADGNITTGKFVTKGYVDSQSLSKTSASSQSVASAVNFTSNSASTFTTKPTYNGSAMATMSDLPTPSLFPLNGTSATMNIGTFNSGDLVSLSQSASANVDVRLPSAGTSTYGKKLMFVNCDSNGSKTLTIKSYNSAATTQDGLIKQDSTSYGGFAYQIVLEPLDLVEMVSTPRGWFMTVNQGAIIS